MNMPKLVLKEYKCQHKNIVALDSIKYDHCKNNCNVCYGYPKHNHKIIYEEGVCNDCSQNFIIKTTDIIPIGKCSCSTTLTSTEYISVSKCHHPQEALNIKEDSIKPISLWWWQSSESNVEWVKASGECSLCDCKIDVKRKCTGVIKNNEQVQIWSNWILI
jgi:hypothetical protein